jgi:hypothetical protein
VTPSIAGPLRISLTVPPDDDDDDHAGFTDVVSVDPEPDETFGVLLVCGVRAALESSRASGLVGIGRSPHAAMNSQIEIAKYF